ncbi:hypothetical protein PAPHI01_2489 [Pancytospora philotis]|nr:hypothetical protein PAPHI01_2489 [Pancytospora philotis]
MADQEFNKVCSVNKMAMTPSSGNLKVPFTFGGRKGEDPARFLKRFEEYTVALGYSEVLKKISLELALEGEAQVWSETLGDKVDFEELKASLLNRFRPRQSEMMAWKELMAACRGPNETLMGFLDRIQVIGRQGGLDREMILGPTLNVLPTEFLARVSLDPQGISWEGLYRAAASEELLNARKPVGECYSMVTSMERPQKTENAQYVRGNCFFCEKPGHYIRNCLALQRLKAERVRSVPAGPDRASELNSSSYEVCRSCVEEVAVEPVLPARVGSQVVTAILDTGSDRSLVGAHLAGNQVLERLDHQIRAANNVDMPILGVWKRAPVKVLGAERQVDLVVTPSLNRKCILGRDFLAENGIRLKMDQEMKLLGEHRILVEGGGPIAVRYRRYSWHEEEAMEKILEEWLEKGIIRHSTSPWRAPLVLVPKKDGQWRMCNDFRALNQLTKRDGYVLPWVDDIFDALAGATIFSKMDAKAGYHQIDLTEEDKEKTAFGCKFGTFEYNKMPFGLVNAPATFQRVMDRILSAYLWKFVVVYLDDIIVFSKSVQEHEIHLRLVTKALGQAGLMLNEQKCEYQKEEIEALGHQVSAQGIKPVKARIEAIVHAKLPTTRKEMQSYLGLVNYCRKFIPNLSTISAPLYALTKTSCTEEEFAMQVVEAEAQQAFKRIVEEMSKERVLALPRREGLFILTTDASELGVGAVLSQIQEEEERPIAFYSALHSGAEQRYSTTEQELLAIVSAVRHFRYYLLGRPFKLRTDHKALVYLWQSKDKNNRLFRWAIQLQEFSFELEYLKGAENYSDVLSRAFNCLAITEESGDIQDLTGDEAGQIREFERAHMETGHGSAEAVKYLLAREFYWKGMKGAVEKWCKNCKICQMDKEPPRSKSITPMEIWAPDRRWEIDLIGPLENGEYIMTAIDVFTRFAQARRLRAKEAESVIRALHDMLRHARAPAEILCDNGREFVNQAFEEFCARKGIKVKHGAPYTPTTTGAIERFNQTLMSKIRKLSEFGRIAWSRVLQKAIDAYNICPSRATGVAPAEIVDLQEQGAPEELAELLDRISIRIRRYHGEYRTEAKPTYEFHLGEDVWYKDHRGRLGKLAPLWFRRGRVQEILFKAVRILTDEGKLLVVHHAKVKPVCSKPNEGEVLELANDVSVRV